MSTYSTARFTASSAGERSLAEIAACIADVASLPLSADKAVERLTQDAAGAATEKLLAAALMTLRDRAKRIFELEREVEDLIDDHNRLLDEIDDLQAALAEKVEAPLKPEQAVRS